MIIKIKHKLLSEVVVLNKGKPPAQIPYFGEGATYYLSPEYLRCKAPAELAKPSAKAVWIDDRDTVLLWDGSNAGEIFRGRKGLLASTMTYVSHGDEFDTEYFFYALKKWEPYLKGHTSGSGIPHVDKEILGKLEILEFDKAEQTQISEILSMVDRAIEQTEALIAKQQRIKTGLMQDLLTKGIDEHGNIRSEENHEFKDTPLGRIPVEWEIVNLRNFAPLQRGFDIIEENIIEGTYPVISSSGIIGFHNKWTTSGPGVTVGRKGTIGLVHYVEGDFWAHDTSLFVTNFNDNCVKYVFYLYTFLDLQRFGTKSGSPSLNRNDLHPNQLSVPNRTEQIEIIKVLEAIDQLIEDYKSSLNKFTCQKTALMQDLLTGTVRVTKLLNEREDAKS